EASAVASQAVNGIPPRDDFWLLGDFTQNLPCKGDGSEPPEGRVKITYRPYQSKAGVCNINAIHRHRSIELTNKLLGLLRTDDDLCANSLHAAAVFLYCCSMLSLVSPYVGSNCEELTQGILSELPQ